MGKLSGLYCAVLCVTIVHSAMHTHLNKPNSCLLLRFSLWFYCVLSLSVLDLDFCDYFPLVYLCTCAFVVLD